MRGHEDWAGIFPAALTIFDEVGRLDEDATAAHIDRLVREARTGWSSPGRAANLY